MLPKIFNEKMSTVLEDILEKLTEFYKPSKLGHVTGPIEIVARDNRDKIFLRLAKGSVNNIFNVSSLFE